MCSSLGVLWSLHEYEARKTNTQRSRVATSSRRRKKYTNKHCAVERVFRWVEWRWASAPISTVILPSVSGALCSCVQPGPTTVSSWPPCVNSTELAGVSCDPLRFRLAYRRRKHTLTHAFHFCSGIGLVRSSQPPLAQLPLRPFNRDFTSRPHDEAKTTKITMSDETQPGRVLRKRQAQISYSEKDEFDLEDLLEGERCPRHPAMVCPFLTLAANYSSLHSLPTQSTSNTA